MITFKAMIIPGNRRKDGTNPVKIRVTFRGVSRRLPTTLVCSAGDLTRGNKIKNPDILSRADELIARMRVAVRDISPFDLECRDVDWVVDRIRRSLSGSDFRLDFFAWADSFIATKSPSTARIYRTAVNAFERFLGRRTIDINAIDKAMILDFIDFASSEGAQYYDTWEGRVKATKSARKTTSSVYHDVKKLKTIHTAAKDRYNDDDSDRPNIPKSPFKGIELDKPMSHGQRNLGQPLMQRLISLAEPNKRRRQALDAFIVSFGLMGANMADLSEARSLKGGVLRYNRQKTKNRRLDRAEMRVEVPKELQPFISRLQSSGGSEWWLPDLHATRDSSRTVNRNLANWCRDNGVEVFTFYAARHTWASLARKAGVDKAIVDECLVHIGDYQMADIYAERDWELLNEANRKVLALFEWPEFTD